MSVLSRYRDVTRWQCPTMVSRSGVGLDVAGLRLGDAVLLTSLHRGERPFSAKCSQYRGDDVRGPTATLSGDARTSSGYRLARAVVGGRRRLTSHVGPLPSAFRASRTPPPTSKDQPRSSQRTPCPRQSTGLRVRWGGEAEADKSCRSPSKCSQCLVDAAADVQGPTATLPGVARPSSG